MFKFGSSAVLIGLMSIAGCSATPQSNSPAGVETASTSHAPVGGEIRERNQAYSLLYDLMDKESNVDKLFIVKSASDPVKTLVKQIAAACKSAHQQMEDFPKQDKQIEFDVTDLPKLEQRSRDLEAKDQEHILLTSSGKEFELRLIFTQAQAMGYARQLCRALLEKETDPSRKAFLSALADQCGGFHDQMMKMLNVP
jgi:hypothetical protein